MKKKFLSAFLIAIVLTIFSSSPAFAVANPTSITIHTAKAFQNIFETGDMLFVVSYDINYAVEPSESASYTFSLNLLNTAGTNVTMTRALNYYQYNVISIYATAAQVTSLGLVYGDAYKLRVTGNPAFFASLVEGTNMATRTLTASDWNTDGSLTAKELLRLHCIDIAEALETDWAVTLLVTTSSASQVLNTTGTTTFLDAIPNLDNAIPSLFQVASGIITVGVNSSNATYALESTISNRLGTSIANAFTGIGTWLGFNQSTAAGVWIMLFALTIASIVFLNSGNSAGAILLTIPTIMLGTYLGAIPMTITFTVGIIIVAYMWYFIWLRGT